MDIRLVDKHRNMNGININMYLGRRIITDKLPYVNDMD